MNAEQTEIIGTFAHLLRGPTEDGGRKRERAEKPLWKVDPDHEAAMYRHLKRWEAGETFDADSDAHALVHVAWRALAIAAQEQHRGEAGWIGNEDAGYCPECRSMTRDYRDKLWKQMSPSGFGWTDCTNEWHDATS